MSKTELKANRPQNKLKGLYAITDHAICIERNMPVEQLADLAISGGAQIIQYRNKQSPQETRLYEAEKLAKLCSERGVILLINDDVDIALEVDAAGVHLGQADTGLAEARMSLGSDKLIGITCHNDLELAQKAEQGGADYVAFGRFFPSLSKPSAPPASMDILTKANQELHIPVCAIGGITLNNAPALLEKGVDMLAVVNELFGARDVTQAARDFTKFF